MENYFITGTSRGIGKSFCEQILSKENTKIFGYSRNSTVVNPNYKHFYTDLSNIEEVLKIDFPDLENATKIVLINNSGILGDLAPVGGFSNESIIEVFNINTVAPSILMNNFIRKYKDNSCKKIIINISSGAGRNAGGSWSSYCASKSALDMFSLSIDVEQKNIPEDKRFTVYSIAPGIVDTKMQDEIRDVPKEKFSNVDKFINYKNSNLLLSPNDVVSKIIDFIEKNVQNSQVLLDIRNM